MAELCEAFGGCRSSYYYRRQCEARADPARERLKARVIELHQASRGAAGARSLSAALKREGESVGRYKAGRLMAEAGVTSNRPRAHRHPKADGEGAVAPNHLNRAFEPSAPNQVWCGDITYIWAGTGWLYLAVVLDLFARQVVGGALSGAPNTELVTQALTLAYESRGRPSGVLFHSGLRAANTPA